MKELKIVIAGLANAGKTSILCVLDDKMEQIPLLTPTQGVQYNNYKVLGLDVTAWDLGGQISYREKYLKEYRNYFSETATIYYVIDIQDEILFKESIKYLQDIVDIFPKIGLEDVYIVVLLHKYDTHLQTVKLQAKITDLKKNITKSLAKIPSVFYETTIYEPFSIFQAISDGILHQVPGHALFHEKIKELAEENKASAALFISKKGYVFGAWHAKDVQVVDLAKFYRSSFNSTGLFSKEEKECKVIAGSENFDSLVVVFNYQGIIVQFSLMVPKSLDIEFTRIALQNKRDELLKVLTLLKP